MAGRVPTSGDSQQGVVDDTRQEGGLTVLPCLDSVEMAESRQRALDTPRHVAAALGRSAVEASASGRYLNGAGEEVNWSRLVHAACSTKRSIAPGASLPDQAREPFADTRVQVANETTLGASRRLVERGLRPLTLNFANGLHPGGGFPSGEPPRLQWRLGCLSLSSSSMAAA